jgi:hypothetical protein
LRICVKIRGLKIELHIGEGDRQFAPQLLDILCRRRVAFLQFEQDLAVIDTDRRALGERQIVGALRQPDVVEDESEVLVGDLLTDIVLDRMKNLLGALDAGTRWSTDMQLDEPGIDLREKIRADEQRQNHRAPDNRAGDERR